MRTLILLAMIVALGGGWQVAGQDTEAPPTAEVIEASPTPLPTETPLPTLAPTDVPTASPEPTQTAIPTDIPTEVLTATSTAEPEATLEITETLPAAIATESPTLLPELPELRETVLPRPISGRGRDARVDADLLALYDALAANNLPAARQLATDAEMLISNTGDRVRIEVLAVDEREAQRVRLLIEAMGGSFLIGYQRYSEYDFPLVMLDALNATPGEFTVRQPMRPITLNGTVVSEGVAAMGVPAWHNRGFRGQGIRVGVIDAGYFGHPNSDTGCVRGSAGFDPFPITLTSFTDHGTNVAEIICDTAPQAQVFIASANSVSAFSAAVDWLISQDVQIISMSMQWFDNPGDGTGIINDIVNRATSRGILWVNSAGNSNGYTWDGAYSNMSVSNNTHQLFTGYSGFNNVMNFGGLNPVLRLNGCGLFQIAMRFSDWNAARTGNQNGYDIDLYLMSSTNGGATWQREAFSTYDQAGSRSIIPTEYLSANTFCSPDKIFGVMVARFSTTAPVYIQLETYGATWQTPSAAASITTPADNPSVVAVAASEVKPHPGWGWSTQRYPDAAPYSSRGPALGPGGTNPATSPYQKPDISAPTNTRTTRSPAFNGTSASAPHVAGAFAVLLSYDPTLTRSQLITFARQNVLSESPTCSSTPTLCFGSGVLTMPSEFLYWGDSIREHTHPSVIVSGIPEAVGADVAGDGRWVTVNTGSLPVDQRASGGNFIASRDDFAQVEFAYSGVSGVSIAYYQMPGWAGCQMNVLLNGSLYTSVALDGGGSYVRSTLNINEPAPDIANEMRIQLRSGVNCGVTFDTVVPLAGEVVQETDPRITYAGSWSRPTLAASSGGGYRMVATAGASATFLTTASSVQLIYTSRPDGGFMDVLVNGTLYTSIDTYSPRIVPQAIFSLPLPAAESVVQLVATGRRNPASRGAMITLDALRFVHIMGDVPRTSLTAEALPARPNPPDASLVGGVRVLPVNGVWTRSASSASFGGARWAVTTPNAQVLMKPNFTSATNRRLLVYFTGAPNGGIAEITVNGVVCSACGQIDTYRPANMPRSVAYITLPNSLPAQFTLGLRTASARHPSATGNALVFEGVEFFNANPAPLLYYDAAMKNFTIFMEMLEIATGNEAPPRALAGAVYGDIHAIAARPTVPVQLTTACTADTLALIFARSPQGAQIVVEYLSTTTAQFEPLAIINTHATRTLPREMALLQRPPDTAFSWEIRIRGQAQPQQTGSTTNFAFIDGVLALSNHACTLLEVLPGAQLVTFGDTRRQEIGSGWGNAPAAINAPSASAGSASVMRRTNTPGASLQFTYDPTVPISDAQILYVRQPDGGIADVFVNGVRIGEMNFYSPTPLYNQHFSMPVLGDGPLVVEIRNTNRRSPGSSGTWMYVDAIAMFSSQQLLPPYHTTFTRYEEYSTLIQRIGSAWSNLPNAPANVNGPLIAAQSIASHGAVRFTVNSDSFWLVRTLLPNGGHAEVFINGQRCTQCGLVSFFNQSLSYRASQLITVPGSFGSAPHTVELRALATRPIGSSGTVMTLDAVIPVSGGLQPSIYTDFTLANTTSGTWTVINLPPGANGAERAINESVISTSQANTCAYVQAPSSNPTVTVYHTTQPSGGIAEIRTASSVAGLNNLNNACGACGTLNSYSAALRYQVPYTFTAPVQTGDYIGVCNLGIRQPGASGFVLQVDAVTFR